MKTAEEFLFEWEIDNNPFYPKPCRWDYTMVAQFAKEYDEHRNNFGVIEHNGYAYWYEYKLAKHRVDFCLSTKNPQKYCNGYYLYSDKDPGDGKCFVIVKSTDPNININH